MVQTQEAIPEEGRCVIKPKIYNSTKNLILCRSIPGLSSADFGAGHLNLAKKNQQIFACSDQKLVQQTIPLGKLKKAVYRGLSECVSYFFYFCPC